jgi:hypothetical protein
MKYIIQTCFGYRVSVLDHGQDPDWIRIQLGLRIRIQTAQYCLQKKKRNKKGFYVLRVLCRAEGFFYRVLTSFVHT